MNLPDALKNWFRTALTELIGIIAFVVCIGSLVTVIVGGVHARTQFIEGAGIAFVSWLAFMGSFIYMDKSGMLNDD